MSTYESTLDASFVPQVVTDAIPQAALSFAAIEQYRALARRLDANRNAGGPKAFVVTSPCSGDGRTSTALYTAVALAGRGHRVVLADLDLRKPDLAARHDMRNSPGIVEVVRGLAALDEALALVPGVPGLTLLASGEVQMDPAPLFFDPRMGQLLEALHSAFDFLVCDSPPALGCADASCLADMLGGALLVSRAGRTYRRELAATAASLAGANVIGSVLVGVENFASIEATHAEEVAARRPLALMVGRR